MAILKGSETEKNLQTAFAGEPWHLRYLGVELAREVFKSGLPLETYLGVSGGGYE
jgi:hypothetical protein